MDKKKTVVVALGHRALGSTLPEQQRATKEAAKAIADLAETGANVVISHSNSQQVGMIHMAMNEFAQNHPEYTTCPMSVCSAMSQGYIGYHIQQALKYALATRNRNYPVVALTTQMIVDKEDPAFRNPTKPIGAFYTEEQARLLEQEKGYAMREDAGRGWRRVVASPKPKKIVEIGAVKLLWDHAIVITCGGGGVPVVEHPDGTLEGVAAVIDKDFAAELLAEEVDADALLILTEVEKVAINFGTPDQKDLGQLSLSEAARYAAEGQFGVGSMLPKVEAAMKFVRANPGKKAIITSLDKCLDALDGKSGTVITFA